MDGANGARGQPNFSKQVFEIALRPTCSDGKIWPEDQYKTAERLNLGESDADRRKHQEYLLKLGGLLRDQFLIQDPVARGIHSTNHHMLCRFPLQAILISGRSQLHPERAPRILPHSQEA